MSRNGGWGLPSEDAWGQPVRGRAAVREWTISRLMDIEDILGEASTWINKQRRRLDPFED